MALPYWAGKSSNTKDTTYTKGKQGAILRAFFLRDLCVLCGKKDFPVKNGRAKIPKRFYFPSPSEYNKKDQVDGT
jgi:hypothetical protein